MFQDDSAFNSLFPWKNLRNVSTVLDILGNTGLIIIHVLETLLGLRKCQLYF